MKYRFKRKPRRYQLNALKKALELGKLGIWFDPGLGKTKVAIDFTAIKLLKQEAKRVLIVGPLSAVGIWEDEFYEDCPEEAMPTIMTVQGSMKQRLKMLDSHPDFNGVVVMNYDSLRNKEVFAWLTNWRPQLLICDEAHMLKNPKAQRTQQVLKIRKTAQFVLELTGTPMPKDPRDLFGQYTVLDDSVFGADRGAYKRFLNKYCVMNYKFPTKVDAWKNLDELARVAHSLSYRAKDTECIGLPELIIRDIPVTLDEKTKDIYNQMATEMVAEIDAEETITATMAATKVLKLQQITGGFVMKKDEYLDDNDVVKTRQVTFPVGTEKLDVCTELIEKYVDNHKIIIGCRFIWEVNQLADRLEKKGIEYAIIRGGVSGEERTEIRRDFQETEHTRVIIFQISAATAMTLTKADIGILYSSTQRWDDYWQWLKRLHREGQDKPVYVLRLVVKGSIDTSVIRSLNEKRAFTDYMVDRQSIKGMIKLL